MNYLELIFFAVVVIIISGLIYLFMRLSRQYGRSFAYFFAIVLSGILLGPAWTLSTQLAIDIPLMVFSIMSVPILESLLNGNDSSES